MKINETLLTEWKKQLAQKGLDTALKGLETLIEKVQEAFKQQQQEKKDFEKDLALGRYDRMSLAMKSRLTTSHDTNLRRTRELFNSLISAQVETIEKEYGVTLSDVEKIVLDE